jgi:hypothetical protein
MPHPLILAPSWLYHTAEASVLAMAGTSLAIISEQDWNRMTGPHGVAFIAVAAVIVLWANGLRKERLEQKRRDEEALRHEARRQEDEANREKRHKEAMSMQSANADRIMDITVESIKAQGHSAQAIASIDSTIKRLSDELSSRPCAKI